MKPQMVDPTSVAPNTPLRLDIAAKLAFPDGSMTASGLRREIAKGRLTVETIAGKQYTTLANVEEMRGLCRTKPNPPDSGSETSGERSSGTSLMTDAKSQLAAALMTARGLKKSSRNTSRPASSRRHDSGRDPAAITIAEILNIYQQDRGAKIASPQELGQRVTALLGFFGTKPVTALNKRLCRDYAVHRGSDHAARRQLEDLRAALGHAYEEKILDIDFRRDIELPAKAPARERWLTRSEAARLFWAAWRYREVQNFRGTNRKTRQHVARFILVALYTGTRSAAVCGAAMGPAIGRGYVDLDQGVLYRRAPGTAETSKRQPPVRLPDRLLAHMRRWNAAAYRPKAVVEFNGEPVLSVKKAFARCVAEAGLEGKVSPHTLRHTAISWALQNGAPIMGRQRLLRRLAGSDQSRLWAPLPGAAQGGRQRHHPQAA